MSMSGLSALRVNAFLTDSAQHILLQYSLSSFLQPTHWIITRLSAPITRSLPLLICSSNSRWVMTRSSSP